MVGHNYKTELLY